MEEVIADIEMIAEDPLVRQREMQKRKDLEEEIARQEELMLKAACEIVKVYPQLTALLDETKWERAMGNLRRQEIDDLCVRHKRTAEESDFQASIRANQIFEFWNTKLQAFKNAVGIPGFVAYEEEDMYELQRNGGHEVYRRIRKAFTEIKVANETQVFVKPWNEEEDREATLAELMIHFPVVARSPRIPPSRRQN